MTVSVLIQDSTHMTNNPTLEQFQHWANTALSITPDKINQHISELAIRIVDKEESAYLNETFRHKQGPTNVLSFPDQAVPGEPSDSLGDLAICAKLVEEEAQQQQKSAEAHWAHLTIHGILHLLSYDHIKDDDAKRMENLEIKILQQLGYGNPYE